MPYRGKRSRHSKSKRTTRSRAKAAYRSRYQRRNYGYNLYKAPRNIITSAVLRYWDNSLIGNVTNNTVGIAQSDAIAPALSDMQGSSPWINLFAQYRVMKIKVEFIPAVGDRYPVEQAGATAPSSVTATRPMFATTINRVATSFPQDMESALSTSSVKYGPMGRYYKRYYSPVTFDEVYRAGVGTTNAHNPEYGQWLSTNMANVAQHGLNWVISAADHCPTNFYRYRKIITMYCQFKNRRVNTVNAASEESDEA